MIVPRLHPGIAGFALGATLIMLSIKPCPAQAGGSKEVFSDIPENLSKWESPEIERVQIVNERFSLKSKDRDKNIELKTIETFPPGHSYTLSASNIYFATKFNNSSAYFYFGFGSNKFSMPLCLKLTRFGDNSKLVYNGVEYPLAIKPYLDAGGVEIQIEYDHTSHRVVVVQTKGRYKKNKELFSAWRTSIILYENTFPEPANFESGMPIIIRAMSRTNGGTVGENGATISNIMLFASP